jgi:hypothetical protein
MAWMPDDGQQPASPWLILTILVGYGLIVVAVGALVVYGFHTVLQ